MKQLNKTDLIDGVAEATGLTKTQTREVVQSFLDAVVKEVKMGSGRVALSGFGQFTTKVTRARQGRDPRTQEVLSIPAASTIRFRASKTLRQVDA
jgi:DNA-binding protein HU-beta